MAPVLHDVNTKRPVRRSVAVRETHQTPTKVLPKRKANSVVNYSTMLLDHNYSMSVPPNDETPSKAIANQLMKMGFDAEEDEADENLTVRPPSRSTRNTPSKRSSTRSPARSTSKKVQPASEPRRRLTVEESVNELRAAAQSKATPKKSNKRVVNSNKKVVNSNKVVLDGEELKVHKPVIKLRLVKQHGSAFTQYRVANKDSPFKNEEGSNRRRSARIIAKEQSDEEYSDSSESESDADSSDFIEDEPSPPKRGRRQTSTSRKSQVSRSANKKLFESPGKSVLEDVPTPSCKNAWKSDTLEAVRLRLHTSQLPERLPCREAEFEQISNFIRQSVQKDALSRSMYVSGVPGTGKTATVCQVIRHLKRKGGCAQFDFVMVNGMEVADPKNIFADIYTQLFDHKKKIAPATARRKLNDMFQNYDASRKPIVIIVDELDLLCTKRQEIVYDIFNWSSNDESRVAVLAIANTLDLPERLLTRRVGSRLGLNRVCFQPYDHDQIGSIIRDRLCGSCAVQQDAVELASRKVAALSGDLRKAFDILRRAAQLAINANKKQLDMKNVQEAVKEASTTPSVELVRSLSKHSVLILRAALAEQTSSGLDEFPFRCVVQQYRLQCHVEDIAPLSVNAIYRNAIQMCSMRLLASAPGVNDFTRRFRLGMTAYETKFAFKRIDESIL